MNNISVEKTKMFYIHKSGTWSIKHGERIVHIPSFERHIPEEIGEARIIYT